MRPKIMTMGSKPVRAIFMAMNELLHRSMASRRAMVAVVRPPCVSVCDVMRGVYPQVAVKSIAVAARQGAFACARREGRIHTADAPCLLRGRDVWHLGVRGAGQVVRQAACCAAKA